MLHDYDRGRSVTKFTHQFQRCVCVVVIIVGEFLALDLLGLRDAVGRGTKRQIKRSVLVWIRSEEHKSELQSLMSNSYDVVCLKKKTSTHRHIIDYSIL